MVVRSVRLVYCRVMIYGIEVGALVRLPAEPTWGLGQVQSIVGDRITVNFEHQGKITLVGANIALELIASDEL